MLPVGPAVLSSTPEAEAFVRFCYHRRRVGWPELYDEMCAVATRGLYQGMGHDALSEIGIGFSLFETPRLAHLVTRIVAEEQAARKAAKAGTCPLAKPMVEFEALLPTREIAILDLESPRELAAPAA